MFVYYWQVTSDLLQLLGNSSLNLIQDLLGHKVAYFFDFLDDHNKDRNRYRRADVSHLRAKLDVLILNGGNQMSTSRALQWWCKKAWNFAPSIGWKGPSQWQMVASTECVSSPSSTNDWNSVPTLLHWLSHSGFPRYLLSLGLPAVGVAWDHQADAAIWMDLLSAARLLQDWPK